MTVMPRKSYYFEDLDLGMEASLQKVITGAGGSAGDQTTRVKINANLHALSKANLSKMSFKFKTPAVSEASSRTGTNLL